VNGERCGGQEERQTPNPEPRPVNSETPTIGTVWISCTPSHRFLRFIRKPAELRTVNGERRGSGRTPNSKLRTVNSETPTTGTVPDFPASEPQISQIDTEAGPAPNGERCGGQEERQTPNPEPRPVNFETPTIGTVWISCTPSHRFLRFIRKSAELRTVNSER
jgi:hypothetical protein